MRIQSLSVLCLLSGLTIGCGVAPRASEPDLFAAQLAVRKPELHISTNISGEQALPSESSFQGHSNPLDSQLPAGTGFSSSAGATLMGGSADLRIDNRFTFGPALQIGIADDKLLVAPFGQARYWFNDQDDEPTVFQPFAQVGAGAVYLDNQASSSDWGFLMNVGGGVRMLTGDNYQLGTAALLNFMPGDVAGESFYVSWEVIQFVFDF